MRLAALFLLIGTALGAVATSYYDALRRPLPDEFVGAPPPAPPEARTPPSRTTAARAEVIAALAARPSGTAERAALYDFASHANLRELEARMTEADALADRSTRTFALDVLLARHGELDAVGALAAAERFQMPGGTIAALYYTWLRSAPTAALAALGELDEAQARTIAAGLISLVGNDELIVNRILVSVPPAVADSLVAVSLARVAQDSPAEALARARAITDPAVRNDAVRRVIFAWAERDPRQALEQIDTLDDAALQNGTRAFALGQLAQREPSAAIRYLAALDDAAQREAFRNGLWQQLAATAPELVLERVDSFPAEFRGATEQAALQSLAQRDPQAAMARLARIPPGATRQQLVQSIARSFAERDADGALAWARSLQPPEPAALAAVVAGIATQNPMRALDLAAEITAPMEQMQALHSVVMTATTRDPAVAESLLERVLALPNDAQRQSLVQGLVGSWASRAPAEAAEWLLSNAEHAPSDVVTQVAAQYAQLDAARAASFAGRLPSDVRGAWLRGVASSYAAADPRAALDWVEQFRGTPEYDDTALAILQSAAQYDPPSAARVLESIGREDYRHSAAAMVAMRWANQDPPGAANWAASVRDPGARMGAVSAVAQFWATQDEPSARAWVLGQPSGMARDGGLMALITTTARFDTPDASLLASFSTEQTRLSGVQSAAFGIAQRNLDEARQFIETHVADQVHRDRALQMVERMSAARSRNAGFIPPVGVAPYLGPGVPVPMVGPSGGVSIGVRAPVNVGPGAPAQFTTPAMRSRDR